MNEREPGRFRYDLEKLLVEPDLRVEDRAGYLSMRDDTRCESWRAVPLDGIDVDPSSASVEPVGVDDRGLKGRGIRCCDLSPLHVPVEYYSQNRVSGQIKLSARFLAVLLTFERAL